MSTGVPGAEPLVYQFVCLEYLAAGCDGDIHHLLILLQGVEAAAHVAMEVVP